MGGPAVLYLCPVVEPPLVGRLGQGGLVPVILLHPLCHVVALDYLRDAAVVHQGLGQPVEEELRPRGWHGDGKAHLGIGKDTDKHICLDGYPPLAFMHPQRVAGKVDLHLFARTVGVVVRVVVGLAVGLDDLLELGIAVGVGIG